MSIEQLQEIANYQGDDPIAANIAAGVRDGLSKAREEADVRPVSVKQSGVFVRVAFSDGWSELLNCDEATAEHIEKLISRRKELHAKAHLAAERLAKELQLDVPPRTGPRGPIAHFNDLANLVDDVAKLKGWEHAEITITDDGKVRIAGDFPDDPIKIESLDHLYRIVYREQEI